MKSFRTLLKMLVQYAKSDRSPEFREAVKVITDLEMVRRKRTAARLWVMRKQLREADGSLSVLDHLPSYTYYPCDVRERREAVQKVRDDHT